MNLPDDFVATPEFVDYLSLINSDGMPIFITGNAGTGKSTFLQYFIESLDDDDEPVVLAPTGIAAVNVGGSTIHSFFRFPPRYIHLDSIHEDYRWQRDFRHSLKTIIIDEISMVRADMVDNIDTFLRINMGIDVPFGGVKIIMIGDMHQLPPVVEDGLLQYFRMVYDTPYFFSAKVWEQVQFNVLELSHIFRQKDPVFIKILNNIRQGMLTVDDALALNTRVGRTLSEGYIMLTTTNKIADTLNKIMLTKLTAEPTFYNAKIEGEFPPKYYPTSDCLTLMEGAQVMMLRNGPGYYNGTICKVIETKEESVIVEWEDESGYKHKRQIDPVEFERIEYESVESRIHGRTVGKFIQLPLKLAWAITMHKSQGMTFDKVQIDFGFGSFAHGQTYVALSRCRSLEGISLKRRIGRRDIVFDKTVKRIGM